MTVFDPPPSSAAEDAPRRSDGSRRIATVTIGWALLASGVIGALVLGLLPAPYVIERPGPVFDTLGDVQVGDDLVPLIDIPDERTYETSGSLDLLTVNIQGSRQEPLTWVDVALAWFDRSRAVVPIEVVYPEGVTDEQSDEQSRVEMETSQNEAVAAALRELGYEVPGTVLVEEVVPDSPAAGQLEPDDEVISADGTRIDDVTALRGAIAEHGTGSPVSLGIRRDGDDVTVEIVPTLSEPDASGERVPIVGILTGARYDFPVDVRIQLENVGGPSAGMMFALGIRDKLTPGEMTDGERIAGTGTITAGGAVGPIGGIRQKLYGAAGTGADWFLAPEQNCPEVVGNVPPGLTVYSVATLDDAVTAVDAIASGKGRDALATCGSG